ncbi:MAG: ABC transporter permease subunit [Clostridiales bacterium]|nr:ABC transporter permease subunit [Clostridiales bacterium]
MKSASRKLRVDPTLYLMLLPAVILVAVYSYGPLAGLVIAFQSYDIAMGIRASEWVGLDNFRFLFKFPTFNQVIWNTVYISFLKLVVRFIVPIVVSILLNEIKRVKYKKAIQTMIYLPHFISWVVISGILISVLNPTDGIINGLITFFGGKPIYFLGDNSVFTGVLVVSDAWKDFGYGTIIYMAALTSIDSNLYEAASIDRANRWQKIWNITIPGIIPIMILVGTLSMGNLLNAGFDQVFNLYNPLVYSTGDILDTFLYRIGIDNAQYDIATAAGMIKSAVSLGLVSISYFLAYKLADYRIF